MSVKGSTTSDEVKAKISASQLARWERIRAKIASGEQHEAFCSHPILVINPDDTNQFAGLDARRQQWFKEHCDQREAYIIETRNRLNQPTLLQRIKTLFVQ